MKFACAYGKRAWDTLLKSHDMQCTYQIFSDGPVAPGAPGFCGPALDGHPAPGATVAEHLAVFEDQVKHAYDVGDSTYVVNSHSGNDFWTTAEADDYFGAALDFQRREGLRVLHEGHRKRFLHSPWVARDFLPRHPDLEFVADFSHWINVAETDTDDPALNAVIADVAAPVTAHVHCRVGYDHGPQVSDPRAPEWRPYVEGHERWWDQCWAAMAARGDAVATITPEHGPPNYQQTLPYSRAPLADIWDVNHWIALRQQARFAELYGTENTSKLIESETQGLDPVPKEPMGVKPIGTNTWAFPIG